ncbi:hypothetical protein SAMN06265379_101212 [Saccharicrinis carchari]|uniref:Uncharacterized protein n=1 Tax=Saccharicrinis carchari TaxID=1168039 RepID=A0A521AKI7_SACCC|nr:hypothetical protein [Saccharicrinis carchari]SMO35315.1 hypothetical protein SAMN06265379_101212 [Saccharicrinis carchari]
MSNSDDYALKLPLAMQLKPDEIKTPYIPVGVYLQEAEDLYHWCQPDREKLLAAGLDETFVNDLPVLAGATREAQSIWMKNAQARQDAEKAWAEEAPKAIDFRDQMLHTFRYAYRQMPDVLTRIAEISEGTSHADMIQDLNDLAVLGRENPEPLTTIGQTADLFTQAATLSDEMADLRARANGEKFDENEHKQNRDRLYTLLKTAVDEVRQCGKFVFWRQPDRLRGYNSKYIRQNINK